MTATLLRTLTFKSRLNFGKYSEMSVQQVIDIRKKRYIRWCYFNLSGITFTKEVLDCVGILEGFYIDKPGKSEILFDEHERGIPNTNLKYMKVQASANRKNQLSSITARERIMNKKSYNRSKNQY
jgi:hypothetical protein